MIVIKLWSDDHNNIKFLIKIDSLCGRTNLNYTGSST
jgi:hypothetical protein